jgi:hypothetical protein
MRVFPVAAFAAVSASTLQELLGQLRETTNADLVRLREEAARAESELRRSEQETERLLKIRNDLLKRTEEKKSPSPSPQS